MNDPILILPLEDQCKALSITIETILAARGTGVGVWKQIGSRAKGDRVEKFALKHFQSLGWSGLSGECKVFAVITAALNYEYEKLTGSPIYGYLKSKHASFLNPVRHEMDVSSYIRSMSTAQFQAILNRRFSFCKKVFGSHELKKKDCLDVWQLFGNKFIDEWSKCGGSSRGASDLVLWKDNQRRFVEVKAKGDKLRESQIVWIRNVVRNKKLNYSILHVVPPS